MKIHMSHVSVYRKVLMSITLLSFIFIAFVYGEIQQTVRSLANDTQVEASHSIATALQANVPPEAITGGSQTDLASTESVFLIIYDASGAPLASTVTLNGSVPVPPEGVFEYAKAHSENRVTWAPQKDLRFATVIRSYTSTSTAGFVLVGKSLTQTENRNQKALWIALAAWILIVLVSAVGLKIIKI
jgi:hypothetical protein